MVDPHHAHHHKTLPHITPKWWESIRSPQVGIWPLGFSAPNLSSPLLPHQPLPCSHCLRCLPLLPPARLLYPPWASWKPPSSRKPSLPPEAPPLLCQPWRKLALGRKAEFPSWRAGAYLQVGFLTGTVDSHLSSPNVCRLIATEKGTKNSTFWHIKQFRACNNV